MASIFNIFKKVRPRETVKSDDFNGLQEALKASFDLMGDALTVAAPAGHRGFSTPLHVGAAVDADHAVTKAVVDAGIVTSDANAAATAADVVTTNADVVTTNADALATAADVVATGADALSAGSAASSASSSASAAATSASAASTSATAAATSAATFVEYIHPNHAGDVTSVGDGPTTIAAKAVTLPKMADMATASLLGRSTAAAGNPEVLSAAAVRSLLGVESGATADQTASEIKSAYESNANTNAFLDAEKSKLTGIESGATADQSKTDIDALGVDAGSVSGLTAVALKSGRKNHIINGNFDMWQRGNSFTGIGAGGAYTADRLLVTPEQGAVCTVTKQAVEYVAGAGNVTPVRTTFTTAPTGIGSNLGTRFEEANFLKLAGKTTTLSFYAKASKSIQCSTSLFFATGTNTISPGGFTLTTAWQKIEVTLTLGSDLGTTANPLLQVIRDGSTATILVGDWIEIAQVQLEEGSVATDFEQRSIGEELALCRRYYRTQDRLDMHRLTTIQAAKSCYWVLMPPMHSAPTVTFTATDDGGATNTSSKSDGVRFSSPSCTTGSTTFVSDISADAEL